MLSAEHQAGICFWHSPSPLWLRKGMRTPVLRGRLCGPWDGGWGVHEHFLGLRVRRGEGVQQGDTATWASSDQGLGVGLEVAWWVAKERQRDQQGWCGLDKDRAESHGCGTQRAVRGAGALC